MLGLAVRTNSMSGKVIWQESEWLLVQCRYTGRVEETTIHHVDVIIPESLWDCDQIQEVHGRRLRFFKRDGSSVYRDATPLNLAIAEAIVGGWKHA